MFRLGLFLYIILIPISILSLAGPIFKGRGIILSTVIIYLLYKAEQYPFTSDPSTRFSLELLWYLYLGTVEKLLISVPEKSYWRLGQPREEALFFPAFGWKKLKWATALSMTMRGVGWNFQVRGVSPSRKDEARTSFLIRQLRDLVVGFIALDACSCFLARCRYASGIDESLMNASNLSKGKWLAMIFVMGFQSYFANHFLYWVCSILAVATGFHNPQDWPPLFGQFKEASTLRFFWGGFWHQNIRKILSGYAYIMLRVLGIPRHGIFPSVLSLFLAFTISGLYHGYASYALPYPTALSHNATTYDRFGRFLVFFMIQPIGIILEDLVIRLYNAYTTKKVHSRSKQGASVRWQRWVGYLWVTSWMVLSGSILVDHYLKTEMGRVGSKSSLTDWIFDALSRWLRE